MERERLRRPGVDESGVWSNENSTEAIMMEIAAAYASRSAVAGNQRQANHSGQDCIVNGRISV
jgi:hypothetical protein